MSLWSDVDARIAEVIGTGFRSERRRAVGGGSINAAHVVEGGGRAFFVKTNRASRLAMFEAEAEGLAALAAAEALRVPHPVGCGTSGEQSYIVMEHVPLAAGGRGSAERLGEGLARLHRTCARRFGWHRDNTIGSTPQPNPWSETWLGFWREQRLGYQLALAARNGYGGRLQRSGEELLAGLAQLLAGHRPVPSLLHGDLWSGNYAYAGDGAPVIFDPATYYGDREADLAMTELFGGFPGEFYAAYRSAWPLDAGYGVRKQLYNLYHVLNHLNLFGGGYASQAQGLIDRLLAELG